MTAFTSRANAARRGGPPCARRAEIEAAERRERSVRAPVVWGGGCVRAVDARELGGFRVGKFGKVGIRQLVKARPKAPSCSYSGWIGP